jgi:shikimate kinase
MSFEGHIILIGPIGAGKTPVAEMIAADLKIKHVMLDLDEYYTCVGWNYESEERAYESGGVDLLRYFGQFTIPLIKQLIEVHPSAVIDCGGTDLVGVTEEDRQNIRESMESLGLHYIAAIIPFETSEETEAYFTDQGKLCKWNKYLISNPSYTQIANRVFYTHGGPLETVAKQIIAWVQQ